VRRLEVVASVDAQSRDRSLKIMFPSGAYVSITTESELEDPLLADLLSAKPDGGDVCCQRCV
jgi:hypothetical protein